LVVLFPKISVTDIRIDIWPLLVMSIELIFKESYIGVREYYAKLVANFDEPVLMTFQSAYYTLTVGCTVVNAPSD